MLSANISFRKSKEVQRISKMVQRFVIGTNTITREGESIILYTDTDMEV